MLGSGRWRSGEEKEKEIICQAELWYEESIWMTNPLSRALLELVITWVISRFESFCALARFRVTQLRASGHLQGFQLSPSLLKERKVRAMRWLAGVGSGRQLKWKASIARPFLKKYSESRAQTDRDFCRNRPALKVKSSIETELTTFTSACIFQLFNLDANFWKKARFIFLCNAGKSNRLASCVSFFTIS